MNENKNEAPRYEIRSLDDFGAVPDDRLDACLAEFAVAIRQHRAIGRLYDAVAQEMHGAVEVVAHRLPLFTWIDDGERNITINLGVQTESAEAPLSVPEGDAP